MLDAPPMELTTRVAEASLLSVRGPARAALEAWCNLAVELGFTHAAVICLDEDRTRCISVEADAEIPRWVHRELRHGRPARAALRGGVEYRSEDFRMLPLFVHGSVAGGLVLGLPRAGSEPEVPSWLVAHVAAALERRTEGLQAHRTRREQLRAAQERRAVRAQQERQLTLARHDLKAPLVPVKGYVDMMLRGMAGPLTPNMQRYLSRMKDAVDRLRVLIDARLRPTGASMVDLGEVVAQEARAFERAGVKLRWSIPSEPCVAAVHPAELRMAIHRLLGGIAGTSARGTGLELSLTRGERDFELCFEGDAYAVIPARTARLCDALVRRNGGVLLTALQGVKVTIPKDPAAAMEASAPAAHPSPPPPSRAAALRDAAAGQG